MSRRQQVIMLIDSLVVIMKTRTQKLFFGLDPLGRRSLLAHKPSIVNPYFLLSSVSIGYSVDYDFEEVSTNAIYCVDLGTLSSLNYVGHRRPS
jgi:hypothetical protein